MAKNFICREDVLYILGRHAKDRVLDIIPVIESLWMFPAPNPTEADGKNVMGQTEQEFWDNIDKQGRY